MDAKDTTDQDAIKDFESAIGELEEVVKRLESGELSLEESLRLYERGVRLSRFCHARLEDAERRIAVLDERGAEVPAPNALTDALADGDDT